MIPQVFIETIDKVVSPIRASGMRKDRMQEELAAHLAASWKEELGQGHDELNAAEQAARRLGDINELSRDLQATVPRLERWLFTPLPLLRWLDVLDRALRRRDFETPLRHAIRVTIGITAAIAALEMVVVPVSAAIQRRSRSDWPTIVLWAVASLVVTAAATVLFPLLFEAMLRSTPRSKWPRVRTGVCLVLSSLSVVGLGLTFVLIVSLGEHQEALFTWSDSLRLLAGSLFAPPLMAFATFDERVRRRGRSGWGLAEIST